MQHDNDTTEQDLPNGETHVDTPSNDNVRENNLSDNNEDDTVDEELGSSTTDTTSDNVMRRPIRQATLMAKEKMKEWLNPSENFICVGSVAIPVANRIT